MRPVRGGTLEGVSVRKSSDIAKLLGSRGRRPSRSGFTRRVRSAIDGWVGRSRWRRDPKALFGPVPGWVAALAVLLAFAGGYFLRGAVPAAGGGAEPPLNAQAPVDPSGSRRSSSTPRRRR
jgi:hypothetical protein